MLGDQCAAQQLVIAESAGFGCGHVMACHGLFHHVVKSKGHCTRRYVYIYFAGVHITLRHGEGWSSGFTLQSGAQGLGYADCGSRVNIGKGMGVHGYANLQVCTCMQIL